MRTFQTLIFLFFCCSIYGQTKTSYNILSSKGDTTFWFKYQQVVINELSLKKLDSSTNSFYFRIWKPNQVIDILRNDNGTYSGQLTTWTSEYVPKKEKHTARTQIYKMTIPADTVMKLVELINSSTILNLPSDNLIKGWKQGFDGITYITEFSTNEQYSFKTYWTPEIQDTLREAQLVQSFVNNVFELANAKNVWQTFLKNIPFACYINSGNIACKVLTKKEKRRYIRKRKTTANKLYLQKTDGCNIKINNIASSVPADNYKFSFGF